MARILSVVVGIWNLIKNIFSLSTFCHNFYFTGLFTLLGFPLWMPNISWNIFQHWTWITSKWLAAASAGLKIPNCIVSISFALRLFNYFYCSNIQLTSPIVTILLLVLINLISFIGNFEKRKTDFLLEYSWIHWQWKCSEVHKRVEFYSIYKV